MSGASVVWFRLDLRLRDNPALAAAAGRGGPVVPVFVWSPGEEGDWPPGAASRWWLQRSLAALDGSLRALGSRLVLRQGPTLPALLAVAKEARAEAVFWNCRPEPALSRLDDAVASGLGGAGLQAEGFDGSTLLDPQRLRTRQGRPFQVFTPFWNALKAVSPAVPLDAPTALAAPAKWPASAKLASFGLEPALPWAGRMAAHWTPGEAAALQRLERFLGGGLLHYLDDRDRPDIDGTSGLSPYLHFGEIAPRTVWHQACEAAGVAGPAEPMPGGAEEFLKQMAWRQFATQLLWHFPATATQPLRREFEAFPWRTDPAALRAWQQGRTGYPLVDAGMRQLWAIGWMHNRVRMVAASFLVKHLLLPWQEGARWFWDTLVDADLPDNTLNWQWTAGCGADSAPYFRIFNPVLQGQRFDPSGAYVRQWVPELAKVPDRWIHQPWAAPPEHRPAGYPAPMVDHAAARARALAALATMRKQED